MLLKPAHPGPRSKLPSYTAALCVPPARCIPLAPPAWHSRATTNRGGLKPRPPGLLTLQLLSRTGEGGGCPPLTPCKSLPPSCAPKRVPGTQCAPGTGWVPGPGQEHTDSGGSRDDVGFTADPRGGLSALFSEEERLREVRCPQQLQPPTQLPLLDAGAGAGQEREGLEGRGFQICSLLTQAVATPVRDEDAHRKALCSGAVPGT